MFEERTIPVMAYNLYTILAEKIETILSRNVTNTRGRDFYDTYILLSQNRDELSKSELLNALRIKAEDRSQKVHSNFRSNPSVFEVSKGK
jgi:predicted nucleotidyltransferase component of viral defense system